MIATERRKVQWTAEEDAELKRIYSLSSAGQAAAAIVRLASAKAITPNQVRWRARKMGITRVVGSRRPWSQAERENLKAYAGRISANRIANILGRSVNSVKIEIRRQQLSRRVRERGYTRGQLADLLGIDRGSPLSDLLMRFPMKTNPFGNFSKDEVALWVYEHMEHIEFRKCDQSWLKEMLKGNG